MTKIVVNLDVMLAKRKMSMTELANEVGVTMATYWNTGNKTTHCGESD